MRLQPGDSHAKKPHGLPHSKTVILIPGVDIGITQGCFFKIQMPGAPSSEILTELAWVKYPPEPRVKTLC